MQWGSTYLVPPILGPTTCLLPLRLDLIALQTSLGSKNLRVEFLHLIGFLLRCET